MLWVSIVVEHPFDSISSSQWRVCSLLHADGIDVCGQRLVSEIQTIVARNPSLERLTIIGHSMGGLLARYAVGSE